MIDSRSVSKVFSDIFRYFGPLRPDIPPILAYVTCDFEEAVKRTHTPKTRVCGLKHHLRMSCNTFESVKSLLGSFVTHVFSDPRWSFLTSHFLWKRQIATLCEYRGRKCWNRPRATLAFNQELHLAYVLTFAKCENSLDLVINFLVLLKQCWVILGQNALFFM